MTKHYEQRKEANERYLAKMDEIRIRMSKESGLKEAIQAHADTMGESVQAFIIRAIQEAMEREKQNGNANKEGEGD
jgi:oligoribonuclease (3'-5' exoribonuclease)